MGTHSTVTNGGSRSLPTTHCCCASLSRDSHIDSRSVSPSRNGGRGCKGDQRMTQIAMSGVAVEFGDTTILRDVTFTVAAGEKWGIVGRNGTGKTTLFNLVTNTLQPTRGAVVRSPGTRITLLEQHRDFGDARHGLPHRAGVTDHLLDLE